MGYQKAKPVVVIVTPAWADANNGNWQTAQRWARHLAHKHTVVLVDEWPEGHAQAFGKEARNRLGNTRGNQPAAQDPASALAACAQVLIALHARRSAPSISAWHQQRGPQGLAVVLTGTDLYKDLHSPDPATVHTVQQSLRAAQALVVLQDHAPQAIPSAYRHQAQVIFQSTTARKSLRKPELQRHPLRALMVGHLREEKDPQTLQQAAQLLQRIHTSHRAPAHPPPPILIDHIGAALEPSFEIAAQQAQAACPNYRWLGAQTHAQTRSRIQRAHVLVHTSRLEGGAHVIMEAVRSGTPVLASRISGNVGMLGDAYAGYFPVGDSKGLAQALLRFQADADFRDTLQRQCEARAALFDPQVELNALEHLVQGLLQN